MEDETKLVLKESMQIPTIKSPPLNIKKNSIINIKPKTIKEDIFEDS